MRVLVCGAAAFLMGGAGVGASPGLTPPERSVVGRYVGALRRHDYAAAFALLSADERLYFGSAANFASGFQADQLTIESARLLGSRRQGALGTIALNTERVAFYDFAHRTLARATMTVPYGIVGGATPRIKDPYHPWRAFVPPDLSSQSGKLRATVRKLAFFTGRLETIVDFANVGSRTVTLLPYDRSVVRDSVGKAYLPLATRLSGLTDRTLYTGLRLAPGAEYTGSMTFVTPPRFVPSALSFAFGPALMDGSDAPFEIDLPRYVLPRS